MTYEEIKKMLKGATLVIWRAGYDTVTETTGRQAHAIINDAIAYEDEPSTATAFRIGKTVWIDESTWTEAH